MRRQHLGHPMSDLSTVKIIPKSQRANNRINEHGEEMELLLDSGDRFYVRSLKNTFSYSKLGMGKWLGWFTKEQADYEKI